MGYSFGALDGGSSGKKKDRSGIELGLDLDSDRNKLGDSDDYECSSVSDGSGENEHEDEGYNEKMSAAREARAYNAAVRDFACVFPSIFHLTNLSTLPLLDFPACSFLKTLFMISYTIKVEGDTNRYFFFLR